MKIAHRIMLGFGLVIIVLAVIGISSVLVDQAAAKRSTRLTNDDMPQIAIANALGVGMHELATVAVMAGRGEPGSSEKLRRARERLAASVAAAADFAGSAPERAWLAADIAAMRTASQQFNTIVDESISVAAILTKATDNMAAGAAIANASIAAQVEALDEEQTKLLASQAPAAQIQDVKLRITLIQKADHLIGVVRAAGQKGCIARETKPIQEGLAKLDEVTAILETVRAKTAPGASADIDEVRDAVSGYRQDLTQLSTAITRLADIATQRETLAATVLGKAQEIATKAVDETTRLAEETNASLLAASRMVIVLVPAGVIISLVAAWLVMISVQRPIERTTVSLLTASNQVGSASAQVADSATSLANGAQQQASSLEETSATLELLSSNTQRNADFVQQADTLARDTQTIAARCEAQSRQIASETLRQAAVLAAAVEAIRSATERTDHVVESIDDIAFQINLLSLNAAVEAARSGEAGAGFAVVAEEVRSLAQRSAEEVKNTAALMNEAKDATSKVQTASRELTAYLSSAVGKEMVVAFQDVVQSSGKVTRLMGEVARSSHEQAHGITQVNAAIADIDRVTQANAITADHSASAAAAMTQQADMLRQLVDGLQRIVHGRAAARKTGEEPRSA